MHPCVHAVARPDKPAFVMAASGIVVTYAQLEERSRRCAQLLRGLGIMTGDTVAICMDNNPRYFELCWAAQRAGLHYTCISSRLTAAEVAWIVRDSGARALFLSVSQRALAEELATLIGTDVERFSVDGSIDGWRDYESTCARFPAERLFDETSGMDMLYSSGTTGRPKGVRMALSGLPIEEPPPLTHLVGALYGFAADCVYLSPAPLYHAAPLRFSMTMQRYGGTVIVMERFDPQWALALIEQYRVTHSQWVPTMFVRMLKLPEATRRLYDLASHRVAIHAAAPCPVEVKRAMIAWWGPIVNEYYAGSEGNGLCAIDSRDWLAHEGSVGRAVFGVPHILDEQGRELPPGQEGTIYFADGIDFVYHNDPQKTADSRTALGWTTLGDVGYLDADGYLYLTDRKAFMIISGGVNIYPQEAENVLITHPRVLDAAVIGVPDAEFGEAVKAVVQPLDPREAGPALEQELIAWCRERIAHLKCPKSVDFVAELPREPTGKLFKRELRERYWQGHGNRII
ncbi:MAG: Long-chain-fatty-acid--CoA ligase FadD13 [Pseudomonadales bacterium]|nr:Long-chain-fatty-acid--CoA ligase FadD13 [Pseudomonadales bacterium]